LTVSQDGLLVLSDSSLQEPMAHGYYYALGLFLSTLFGAIITTHFNYQVETHTAISFLYAAYS